MTTAGGTLMAGSGGRGDGGAPRTGPGATPSAKALQSLAVGVVRHGGRPVGEDPLDPHVLREHVEQLVGVAVVVRRPGDRLVVVAASGDQRARALQGPGDEVEAQPSRL